MRTILSWGAVSNSWPCCTPRSKSRHDPDLFRDVWVTETACWSSRPLPSWSCHGQWCKNRDGGDDIWSGRDDGEVLPGHGDYDGAEVKGAAMTAWHVYHSLIAITYFCVFCTFPSFYVCLQSYVSEVSCPRKQVECWLDFMNLDLGTGNTRYQNNFISPISPP